MKKVIFEIYLVGLHFKNSKKLQNRKWIVKFKPFKVNWSLIHPKKLLFMVSWISKFSSNISFKVLLWKSKKSTSISKLWLKSTINQGSIRQLLHGPTKNGVIIIVVGKLGGHLRSNFLFRIRIWDQNWLISFECWDIWGYIAEKWGSTLL